MKRCRRAKSDQAWKSTVHFSNEKVIRELGSGSFGSMEKEQDQTGLGLRENRTRAGGGINNSVN